MILTSKWHGGMALEGSKQTVGGDIWGERVGEDDWFSQLMTPICADFRADPHHLPPHDFRHHVAQHGAAYQSYQMCDLLAHLAWRCNPDAIQMPSRCHLDGRPT